ncbi:glycosyltransferase family 2 protein [Arthrobacter sp. GMC3]|uniref:glycosyltransferase family 2 protein n=1 Tax=Arthrobacter sp. GMC3 TaxID=2058894 RepID=UPI000CE4F4C9|nr:glycosyltransferase family 2 protein [Arthrobacter sp. GMC3]
MKNSPQFSIIMPSFNVSETVERAIRSVLGQSVDDFELIIVNDASTDNTLEIVNAIAEQAADSRIRVIDLPQNIGLSGVRNTGLDAAVGIFVTFLDADDEYLPNFLSAHLGSLDDNVDISIVGHNVIRTDGSATPRHSEFVGELSGLDAMKAAMLDQIFPFTWDKVYRRTLFEGVRYPLGSTRFEDMTVNIILYPRARLVRSIESPLHRYYISTGSLTWGRIPTQDDTGLALAELEELLPAQYRSGKYMPFYASMHLLITMIVAQSAIMKLKHQPAAQKTIDECRKSLSMSRILATSRVKPKFAAAALLLKVAPSVFSKIYLRYSANRYGLD